MTHCGVLGGYVVDYFLTGGSNFLEDTLVAWQPHCHCLNVFLSVRNRRELMVCNANHNDDLFSLCDLTTTFYKHKADITSNIQNLLTAAGSHRGKGASKVCPPQKAFQRAPVNKSLMQHIELNCLRAQFVVSCGERKWTSPDWFFGIWMGKLCWPGLNLYWPDWGEIEWRIWVERWSWPQPFHPPPHSLAGTSLTRWKKIYR